MHAAAGGIRRPGRALAPGLEVAAYYVVSVGLRDRVEALRVSSPPGAGTTLHAEFPL